MTKARALRLYKLESSWLKAGSGEMGRNNGKKRREKRARAHQSRLERLRRIAEAK